MFTPGALLSVICISFWVSPCLAAFSSKGMNNVVAYYGQGSNQRPLAALCGDDSIDIIILSFVHLFPAQANGYPGLNFGNQCSGEKYRGPGYNGINDPSKDALLKCPSIQRDLNFCRYATPQKKILLSLGGGTDAYQLTGASDGVNLATQLWYMFGPRNQTMVDAGIPRPFDYRGGGFIVDGFDLDIEHPPVDGGAGYIALSKTLQSFFKQALPVKYYLTASPQCVIPDANMKDIIAAIPFDLLFIQFYNTYTCSAKRWARLNPSYTSGGSFANAGFTIFQWTSYLAATTSKDAKIFLGLTTVGTTPDYTLTIQETANIANAYSCNSSFAGVSIWEAESAFNRTSGFRNYFQNLKPALIQAVLGAKECNRVLVSQNGQCGSVEGTRCPQDPFPLCCSAFGYCSPPGSDLPDAWCGAGCQSAYGTCKQALSTLAESVRLANSSVT